MEIAVEADAGPGGAPAPRALGFESRWVAVAERLDRWDGDAYRYYKLRGADGALYIVRLEEPHGIWRLVMFERERRQRAFNPNRPHPEVLLFSV